MDLGKSVKFSIKDSVRRSIWLSIYDLVGGYLWNLIKNSIWFSLLESYGDLTRLK